MTQTDERRDEDFGRNGRDGGWVEAITLNEDEGEDEDEDEGREQRTGSNQSAPPDSTCLAVRCSPCLSLPCHVSRSMSIRLRLS